MLVATVVGVVSGLVGGAMPDSKLDVAMRLYGTIIFVIPIFWLGQIFQLVFAVSLGWFPVGLRFSGLPLPNHVTGLYTIDSLLEGRIDKFLVAIDHLILPSLTLGLVLSGFFTKTVRANLLRTMKADYRQAARARGI